ncbi:MAG: hypothetical protein ACD_76C00053G0010 [uncultured bacterium]|nr:MAG: hypothetical protein ACD_76C00053G0010 [uncultured bacterium]
MFISINGFAVLDDKALRKRWRGVRKPFANIKRRIHATDSNFEELREKSIKLLGRHDVNILSVFQLTQEIPHTYFNEKEMQFDSVYTALIKKLLTELSIGEYKQARIVIDARKHKGGALGEKNFQKDIEHFLSDEFPTTYCMFKLTPSYADILLELADFISNTFYKEYQKTSDHVFQKLGFRLVQIKNPL